MNVSHFQAGAVIYFEGDPTGPLYIVRRGRVQLTREAVGGRNGTEFQAGDLFGVAEALSGAPRIATARALADVEALPLRPHDLARYIASNVEVGIKIVTSLSRELREIDDEIVRRLHLDESGADKLRFTLRAVGDHFARNENARAARYAYGRFLESDPPDPAEVLEVGMRLVGLCESDGDIKPAYELAQMLAEHFPYDRRTAEAVERLRKIAAVLG